VRREACATTVTPYLAWRMKAVIRHTLGHFHGQFCLLTTIRAVSALNSASVVHLVTASSAGSRRETRFSGDGAFATKLMVWSVDQAVDAVSQQWPVLVTYSKVRSVGAHSSGDSKDQVARGLGHGLPLGGVQDIKYMRRYPIMRRRQHDSWLEAEELRLGS
jgi:hypothetical protein